MVPDAEFDRATVAYLKICPSGVNTRALRAAIESVLPTDSGAGRDGVRLDWLERHHVEVRTPARYGSFANFHASPYDDKETSDLRQRIDTAIAGAAGGGA